MQEKRRVEGGRRELKEIYILQRFRSFPLDAMWWVIRELYSWKVILCVYFVFGEMGGSGCGWSVTFLLK